MDDPFGSGMDRPDLESILQRGDVSAEELDAICWYAWSLEGRIHRLELAGHQEPTATVGDGDQRMRDDLDAAIHETAEILQRHGAMNAPLEIPTDIVRLLGDLIARLAPSPGFKPFDELAREIRSRPGAAERIAEIRAEIERAQDESDGE